MSIPADAADPLEETITANGSVGPAAGPGLRPGELLAHYQLDRSLGRGGMGEVWLATDLALDRPVALKVLGGDVAEDPLRRARLFREARAQARIQHRHVCHIYYVGEDRGVAFFAMEYVAGETLAARVARGRVPPDEAIELIRMAALGLREAHRHGFTHRDVKPSNLMVDSHGQVKIVDFGLVTRDEAAVLAVDGTGGARDGGPAGPRPQRVADADSGTGHGTPRTPDAGGATGLVGTPLYMAPEQARGDAVDFRTDIYALGATLHHLIRGEPPFAGDTAAAVISQHAAAPLPSLASSTRLGRKLAAVDRVLARMMAKAPDERHPSYDELIAELEAISPRRVRPAGFFVRGIAALVDLTLVALISPVLIDSALVFVALWPLYLVVLHARWGITLGRLLLEIEVIDVTTGRRPEVPRALLRTMVEHGPLIAAVALQVLGESVPFLRTIAGLLSVLAVIYGVAEMARAAVWRPDKRTLWDQTSRTMVRYRQPVSSRKDD